MKIDASKSQRSGWEELILHLILAKRPRRYEEEEIPWANFRHNQWMWNYNVSWDTNLTRMTKAWKPAGATFFGQSEFFFLFFWGVKQVSKNLLGQVERFSRLSRPLFCVQQRQEARGKRRRGEEAKAKAKAIVHSIATCLEGPFVLETLLVHLQWN